MSRDRRSTSDTAKDRRLTNDLIFNAMGYLNSDQEPDEEFGRVVLDGCVGGKGSSYPPKGHGYPRGDQ